VIEVVRADGTRESFADLNAAVAACGWEDMVSVGGLEWGFFCQYPAKEPPEYVEDLRALRGLPPSRACDHMVLENIS